MNRHVSPVGKTSQAKRLSILTVPPKIHLFKRWSIGSPVSTPSTPRTDGRAITPPDSCDPSINPSDYTTTPLQTNQTIPHVTQGETKHGFMIRPKPAIKSYATKGETNGIKGPIDLKNAQDGENVDIDIPVNMLDDLRIDSNRSSKLVDVVEEDAARICSVTVSRPVLHVRSNYPQGSLPSPRRAFTLPSANSELENLQERDEEYDGHVRRESLGLSNDVWLCSRPPVSPFESCPSLVKSFSRARSSSADFITTPPSSFPGKCYRPFVTRSISTGRLAREFDDEGRVVCLSAHSDRILGSTQSKIGVTSVPRPAIQRFQLSRGTTSSPDPEARSSYSNTSHRTHGFQNRPQGDKQVLHKREKGYAAVGDGHLSETTKGGGRMKRKSFGTGMEKFKEWISVV